MTKIMPMKMEKGTLKMIMMMMNMIMIKIENMIFNTMMDTNMLEIKNKADDEDLEHDDDGVKDVED